MCLLKPPVLSNGGFGELGELICLLASLTYFTLRYAGRVNNGCK